MIESFGNAGTEDVWASEDTKAARKVCPVELWERASRVLDRLDEARALGDLRLPPSNRLHKLSGDLAGFHSVSINMKYRIVFRFDAGRVNDVRIVDYH